MRALLVAALAAWALSCTPTSTTTTPPAPTPVTVRFDGIRFEVGCAPVAEALVDVELPHHGQPKMRAITGLWDHQAVAVLRSDPKGCGVWTLALATGLSATTKTQIQAETTKGVQIFGVTESPVPRNEGP